MTKKDQKLHYFLTQELRFVHNSNISCIEYKSDTEKIVFHFICGFKLQKPIIEKNLRKPCTTNVLIIDPDICDSKVCIFTSQLIYSTLASYNVYICFVYHTFKNSRSKEMKLIQSHGPMFFFVRELKVMKFLSLVYILNMQSIISVHFQGKK